MKELTQEQVKYLFEYRDGGLYWKVKPSRRTNVGSRAGTIQTHGYRSIRVDGKNQREHRLVFLYFHGFLPEYVDHIDGDISNNRIENLRQATISQNQQNRKKNKNNKSGHPNVSWAENCKKWKVQIRSAFKYVHTSYHEDFELACLVASEAIEKYHGVHAVTRRIDK